MFVHWSVWQFHHYIICVPSSFRCEMISLVLHNSWFIASLLNWTHSGWTEECVQGVCWSWSRNISYVPSKLFHICIYFMLLRVKKQYKIWNLKECVMLYQCSIILLFRMYKHKWHTGIVPSLQDRKSQCTGLVFEAYIWKM